VVVHTLQNPNSIRDWRISSVILDILDSIPITFVWEARKVKRSFNFRAHSVTCWATAGSHSGSISTSSIPFLFSSPSSGEEILILFVFCSLFPFLICSWVLIYKIKKKKVLFFIIQSLCLSLSLSPLTVPLPVDLH
jgi:hypothetical protein